MPACSLRLNFVLQEIALQEQDPQEALGKHGVSVPDSAIHYVTRTQLALLRDMLTEMEMSFDYLTASWMLADYLSRARIANYRWRSADRL